MGHEIEPFSIIGLYPVICDLLGIKPRPNNNSRQLSRLMYIKRTCIESPTASQRSVVAWSLAAMLPFVVFLISVFLGQGGGRGKDCAPLGMGATGAATALPRAGGVAGIKTAFPLAGGWQECA